MLFRTEVPLPEAVLRIDDSTRVLLLGSCFADGVGVRLGDALPEGQVSVNPCGVLYNPASIAQTLRLLLADGAEREQLVADSLFLAPDGRWHSWLFSTKYTGATRQEALACCLAAVTVDLELLDVLVLTLGTDRCYQLKADGRVVANCHKVPAAQFDEVDCPTQELGAVIRDLQTRCPRLHVLLTVSPYRYAKYGFHASQLSKARLLLLADGLCREAAAEGRSVTYFPAYEILLDELRDYRFYATDMLHPSEQAADYIFERFRTWCFTPALETSAAERLKALRRQRHITIA